MNRKHIVRKVTVLMLLALLFWTASCATNPVSGGPELMLLSEQDEIKLGSQTDREVRSQYGVYEDPELKAYLDDMCRRLGKHQGFQGGNPGLKAVTPSKPGLPP